MNEIDLAYCAGLIDGEGCIGIYYNKVHKNFQLKLQVQMNEKRPLDKLYKLFGGSFYVKEAKPPRHKQHTWVVFGSKAEEVIKLIRPYMLVKDKQVDEVLKCDWTNFKGKSLSDEERQIREVTKERLTKLNQRGFYG